MLFSVLAYTNGWDVFSPAYTNIFHKYYHTNPIWWKDNDVDKGKNGYDKLQSKKFLSEILNNHNHHPLLGKEKVFRIFKHWVNFKQRF